MRWLYEVQRWGDSYCSAFLQERDKHVPSHGWLMWGHFDAAGRRVKAGVAVNFIEGHRCAYFLELRKAFEGGGWDEQA